MSRERERSAASEGPAALASGEAGASSRKAVLRAEWKALRDALPESERVRADARIRARVLQLPAYRDADMVLAYLSFGSEVDTTGIIEAAWADGKAVALPRCVGTRSMRWFEVSCLDGLETSAFGVCEPRIEESAEICPSACGGAVAIVPGLSFDARGCRLGYGGGYYDAFLASFPGVSVGLCRSAQLSAALLPRGRHDRPVDIVITD